jgi:hypothetical protein
MSIGFDIKNSSIIVDDQESYEWRSKETEEAFQVPRVKKRRSEETKKAIQVPREGKRFWFSLEPGTPLASFGTLLVSLSVSAFAMPT